MRLRSVALWFATALVLALGGARLVAAGQTWTKLFLASFTGVADGPGDGARFPAEKGTITTVTGSGEPFPIVAPASGIFSEQLVLSDRGGKTKVPFGVICALSAPSNRSVRVSFDIDLPNGSTDFSCGVVDTTGVDIATMVLDESGQFSVNGMPGSSRGTPPEFLLVEILLVPAGGKGSDLYVASVTDRKTGKVLDTWTGKISGGYRRVQSLRLLQGDSPGLVVLDNITLSEAK